MTAAEERCLRGEAIWGDDFSLPEIEAWFADEEEGYAALGAAEHGSADSYGYHALNVRCGYRHLPPGRIGRALGLGSAYGGEFLPVISRVNAVTVLEPSAALRTPELRGVPLTYVSPVPNGDMPFGKASFDLVVSFGTLHHIPNVTHVVGEIGRVTRAGGHVLVREPTTSMGDWRRPRAGLTKHERGIPRPALLAAFDRAGLDVVHETRCMFPTTRRLAARGLGFNSEVGVTLDLALSAMTAWNSRYRATAQWHKVQPTASFFVLRRR
ncbi:MAG TPA: class I SAM-dependent methyltransferase [Frankiaceae bacterium]|nr:class I SAM-dependent methyltransferase [Frankiaceae bacterium]